MQMRSLKGQGGMLLKEKRRIPLRLGRTLKNTRRGLKMTRKVKSAKSLVMKRRYRMRKFLDKTKYKRKSKYKESYKC